MNQIIAACGLICSECPAYQATQAGDRAAIEQVAAQWRVEYNIPNITVQDVNCDGCMTGERHCSHCSECEIRQCVSERGLQNCAYCPDFACERLENFFQMVPPARTNLEAVRALFAS